MVAYTHLSRRSQNAFVAEVAGVGTGCISQVLAQRLLVARQRAPQIGQHAQRQPHHGHEGPDYQPGEAAPWQQPIDQSDTQALCHKRQRSDRHVDFHIGRNRLPSLEMARSIRIPGSESAR